MKINRYIFQLFSWLLNSVIQVKLRLQVSTKIHSCFMSIYMTVKLCVYHFHWEYLTFIGCGKNKLGNFVALKKTNPLQKWMISVFKGGQILFQMWFYIFYHMYIKEIAHIDKLCQPNFYKQNTWVLGSQSFKRQAVYWLKWNKIIKTVSLAGTICVVIPRLFCWSRLILYYNLWPRLEVFYGSTSISNPYHPTRILLQPFKGITI